MEKYFSFEYFFIVVPALVFYIGYYGFKQDVIYTSEVKDFRDVFLRPLSDKTAKNEFHKKSGLTHVQMKYIFDRLLITMNEDELYLNSTLSLNDLSSKTNISKSHITQTLNEYGKQNFYDFVNIFRVEKIKKRLEIQNEMMLTIETLAYDSGFNSKSSFLRIFKKFTSMKPSEYKNKVLGVL